MPHVLSPEEKIRNLENLLDLKEREFEKISSELARTQDILDLLQETSKAITSEIELEKLVQRITDKATQLSGAQFGAFFYNTVRDDEKMLLYVISGAPKEAFSKFPLPRLTSIFRPTFEDTKTVRYGDVTKSENYGKNSPYHGMPAGHLPVKSYLAVPVINPITREALGGIFLGHEKPDVFSEKEEKLVEGIALQGAIAMGNAKLFEEKKNTEVLLHQQTDAYKSIFNSTFDAALILDDNANIVEVNDVACVMYETHCDELKNKNIKRLLEFYDPRFLNFKYLEEAGSFHFGSQGVKPSGEIMEVECRARMFSFRNSQHILLIIKDITKVMQAESELRKSRNLSETIAETSPVVLFLTNFSGELDFINSLWLEWTGEERMERHKGFQWFDFIHEQDREYFEEQFKSTFNNNSALDIDVRVVSTAGNSRWVNVRAESYTDQDHFFSGVAGSIMDITLRKDAEEKLREKEEKVKEELEIQVKERTLQLEKINYELLQFTSIASHDLKEPIRKISIFSKLMKDRLKEVLDAGNQKYLNTIIESAGRMTGLINDLLSFSRLSHLESQQFTDISLNAVIERIIHDLELTIEEKQARLVIGELPQMEGIGVQISQVFQNLISNSLKFKDPLRPLTISITCEKPGNEHFKVIYTDTGIGFNTKFSEKIFEVFQRLHTKDVFEGTGIGLSIVKKIINIHNGMVTATGEEGVGARFEILLPYEQENRQ